MAILATGFSLPQTRVSMATYLTPIQVSVRTGIPKSTLAQWRKDGRGPRFVKRGDRIAYPSWEFEVWLETWRREQAAQELWESG